MSISSLRYPLEEKSFMAQVRQHFLSTFTNLFGGSQPVPEAYRQNPYQPGGYQPYQQPQGYGNNPYGQPQQYGYGGGSFGSQPGIGTRILAFLVDLLVGVVGVIPGLIFSILGSAIGDTIGGLLSLVGALLMFVGGIGVLIYQVYLLGSTGATIGKRVMKLKVVDQNGQFLGFGKALAREIVKNLLSNVCFLLLLYPLIDKDKQALYDKIFNSNVYEA